MGILALTTACIDPRPARVVYVIVEARAPRSEPARDAPALSARPFSPQRDAVDGFPCPDGYVCVRADAYRALTGDFARLVRWAEETSGAALYTSFRLKADLKDPFPPSDLE